jgi:hypothetical protein
MSVSTNARSQMGNDMQYAILVYENDADFGARTDGARQAAYWAGWRAYGQALTEAGIMKGGMPLAGPSTGTTVRANGGTRHVQDGPYADTKEQLGGFYIIEVADLDAALSWAARCPAAASGAVEVRPVFQRTAG